MRNVEEGGGRLKCRYASDISRCAGGETRNERAEMKHIFRLGVRMLRLSNFGVSNSSDFPFEFHVRERDARIMTRYLSRVS